MFRKPRVDIYTALLVIALLALILGSIAAYFEVQDYGENPFTGGPSVAMPAQDAGRLACGAGTIWGTHGRQACRLNPFHG